MLLVCSNCFTTLTEQDELLALGARVKAGRHRARERTLERGESYRPILTELRHLSPLECARTLNERGVPTLRGGKAWYAMTVYRLRKQLGLGKAPQTTEPQTT